VDNNRLIFRRRTSRLVHFNPLGICLITIAFGVFISDGVDHAVANMHSNTEQHSALCVQPENRSCNDLIK
jgi:hypothetical protein|tara:strand:- start:870 stop:1079 length:210 start_codon:yes stop_codon:yes gene_type:complete